MKKLTIAFVLLLVVGLPIGVLAKKGYDHYMIGYLESAMVKHDQIIEAHEKAIENEKRDRLVTLCTLFRLKNDLGYKTQDETRSVCVPEDSEQASEPTKGL